MSQYDPFNPPEPQPGQEISPWEMQAPAAPSASVQATMNQMTERLQTVIDAAERAADAIRYDAEEQARRHLAEAQRKADRMTAERVRLISELTDDLIRHAGQVRDHSEQMVHSLEDAISSVTGKLEQPGLSSYAYEDIPSSGYEVPPLPIGEQAAESSPESSAPQPITDEGDGQRTTPAPPPIPEPPVPEPAPAPEQQPEITEPADEEDPAPAAPQDVPQEALLHATRLAVGGSDRETIAEVLREEHGIEDSDAIVDRVLGS